MSIALYFKLEVLESSSLDWSRILIFHLIYICLKYYNMGIDIQREEILLVCNFALMQLKRLEDTATVWLVSICF